jgi:hypothetical protein
MAAYIRDVEMMCAIVIVTRQSVFLASRQHRGCDNLRIAGGTPRVTAYLRAENPARDERNLAMYCALITLLFISVSETRAGLLAISGGKRGAHLNQLSRDV